MNPQLVGALVFALIGLGCLGICSAIVWTRNQFAKRAVSTQGEVIDTGESRTLNSDSQWVVSHAPRVRFVTAQGRTFEFIGPVSGNSEGYARGERVEVIYLPENPKSARINAFDPVWMMAVALFVFGVVFSGIALRALLRKDGAGNVSSLRLVAIRDRRSAKRLPLT